MSGWIKLDREIKNSFLYPKNREFTKYEAWIDLLLLVNFTEKEVLIKNEVYNCKRGQSLLSIESYKIRWKWTSQKVRSFFNLLENNNMIERKATTKTTIITICNYDSYEVQQQTDNKRITNGQQTDNKRITTTKEGIKESSKNDKKEKNIEQFEILNFGNISREVWNTWIENKKIQHNFTFKTSKSEQLAIDELIKLSKNDNETAKKIVNKSIINGYKGLFEFKQQQSINQNNNYSKKIHDSDF